MAFLFAEPLVQVVCSNADKAHIYQTMERVALACELSRPNASVRWYKDGEEVEESEDLLLQSEGSHRRLIIASAQAQDTGEFVCDAGGDSVFFNVTVKGQQHLLLFSRRRFQVKNQSIIYLSSG